MARFWGLGCLTCNLQARTEIKVDNFTEATLDRCLIDYVYVRVVRYGLINRDSTKFSSHSSLEARRRRVFSAFNPCCSSPVYLSRPDCISLSFVNFLAQLCSLLVSGVHHQVRVGVDQRLRLRRFDILVTIKFIDIACLNLLVRDCLQQLLTLL